LKFTGDPGGPTLTHLRRSWAATEVDLKLKHATVGLTDDRFHLLVRLTGGGAREQLGLLQETLLQEVKARNESVQREYKRTLLTYRRELAAYEARPSRRRSKLQKNNQSLPKSLFFLIVSFNQSHGFGNFWKTFIQKGQRLGFQSFGTSR
jgi:hypothetical protein